MDLTTFLTPSFGDLIVLYCQKFVLAAVLLIAGYYGIRFITCAIGRIPKISALEDTVRNYMLSSLRIILWVLVGVIAIQILGVPMASIVTVLASCGLAIGLALQGALSNVAGGVLLMIMRPIKAGEYVSTNGVEGTVKEISLFSTTLVTVDNKRITIPNAQVMNSTLTNFSREELRRVDIDFGVAKTENTDEISALILEALKANAKVLTDPAPFARLTGGDEKQLTVTARAWVKSADYWDVYFDLFQNICAALAAKGVKAPAMRVLNK